MAGLPWFKVESRVAGHPKVQRLERELKIKDALGIVLRLWCWTADYAADGEIPESEAITAAKFARGEACRAPPAVILEALLSAGSVERIPTGYRVHDWDEIQAAHVENEAKKRAQGAERQQRYRERHGNALRNASRNSEVTPQIREEETREEETEADRTVSLQPQIVSLSVGGLGEKG